MSLGAIFGTIVVSSSLALADDEAIIEVTGGVYHYWAMGYGSMIVVGDEGVLVIDPASTPRASAMKTEIEHITDKPIKYVVLSHEHFDHIGGTEIFEDAEVICQRSCSATFALSPMFPTPEVDIYFDDSLEIDLGGKAVELLHPAIGDGNAATIARVEGTGVVFSTDMYRDKGFVPGLFIEHANFVGSRKILHQLLAWNPTYAINGHGPGNSLEALRENAEMYDKLYDGVMAAFRDAIVDGGTQEAINTLFTISDTFRLDEYEDWENYDENFPAHVKRMALSIMHGG